MKRIIQLLSTLILLFCATSCSFTKKSNSVVVSLPSANVMNRTAGDNTSEDNEEITDVEKTVIYDFAITLTDSENVVLEKTGKSGEDIFFDEVTVGPATISIIAYNEEKIACYSGSNSFEVLEGENQVSVTIKKIKTDEEKTDEEKTDNEKTEDNNINIEPIEEKLIITIMINNAATTYEISKESFSLTDLMSFINEQLSLPAGSLKQPVIFENNNKIDLSDATIYAEFISKVNKETVLTVKAGVKITDYSNYLCSAEVSSGEEIYFIDDESVTSIPAKPSSLSSNASDMILDFSDCIHLITVNSSAFVDNNNKWVSVLKLPSSITEINGIRAVKDDVYMPLPDGQLSFDSNVSFDQTVTYLSTYAFHFGGTLADWCDRVISLSTSSGSHPFYNKNYGKDVYFVDSSGTEYSTTGKNLVIEDKYTKSDGTKETLTLIPQNAFRWMKCESIKMSDSITEIEATAFCYNSAHKIYIGSGITKIASGALYYDLWETVIDEVENGNRSIYYNGTVNDWMKINTSTNTSAAEDGPLRGAHEFYIKQTPEADYTNAIDNEGNITVTLDPDDTYAKEFRGQFQAFKAVFNLIIQGTPGSQDYFSINASAFYNCTGLRCITSTPSLDIGSKAFSGCSDLMKVILQSSRKSTINVTTTNHSFSGLSGIDLFVPADLCDAYANDWGEGIFNISSLN